jgi:hypothetical protein
MGEVIDLAFFVGCDSIERNHEKFILRVDAGDGVRCCGMCVTFKFKSAAWQRRMAVSDISHHRKQPG